MARSPLCLLLLRRLSASPQNCRPCSYCHLHSNRGLGHAISKPFSTAPSAPSPDPPKPANLSARLSFVFDQIDAIERERYQKDHTLQRIRAWRESKNAQIASSQSTEPGVDTPGNDTPKEYEQNRSLSGESTRMESQAGSKSEVELVHPWPEWIELMERLVQQNYFDHKRRDEGKMVSALGFDVGEDVGADEGLDFTKDLKTVQTAGLNFGKDRFDILRSLSRQDIQILVGYGCPSADKKVVFSAKLLRKHVHLDEGDICSSCSLRSTCERAFLITNKEDEARTIDIMRVLMAFGFDHMHGTVTNESVLKQKSVKTVVRKLLYEVVKLGSVPIDPNLPPPIIKKPPPKVKQPPPPPKKRVGRDDVEMKKGDWLCPKCDFMNFAKNTVCLQCDAKRPKRQLLPGEWECPECNFLNYRRNVVCFHCECKRPPDQFMEDRLQDTKRNPRTTRLEKTARRTEISNAWNFDFDDDESDGADVATFEHADSSIVGKDSPLDKDFKGPEEDFHRGSRFSKGYGGEYIDSERKGSSVGFDDFDEEDDDDVDSYELETARNNVPSRDFSEFERDSDMEDGGLDSDELLNHSRAQTRSSLNKPSKSMRQRAAFSVSDEGESDFGSDEDLSVHPDWRSSHVADSGSRAGSQGSQSRRRLSYGSDEELGLDSDDDDLGDRFGSRKNRSNNFSGKRRESSRLFSASEESDDDNFSSRKSRLKGSKGGGGDKRRGSNFKGSESRNLRSRSSSGMGNQKRSYMDNDFDMGHSRGSRGGNRGEGSGGFEFRTRRGDQTKRDGRGSGSFGGHRDEDRFGRRQGGRFGKYNDERGGDDDFRNKRRVIER
ncbi:hypothetical protein CRG98_028087 [Punica granatum]|nr:hypothetical protein CRG98_028087 [Punica granatum]